MNEAILSLRPKMPTSWEDSKFFKLWQKEQEAGRDPHKALKDRGWEPRLRN
jgi:hypothetical protein